MLFAVRSCHQDPRSWRTQSGVSGAVAPLRLRESDTQFHVVCFEGPDPYARAGGIASRVTGLTQALADRGFETHLWFVGDPELPGHEAKGQRHLHRWCQWISSYHPRGVYDGEEGKVADFADSLPPYLMQVLRSHVQEGGHSVILAEEWQTADAVLNLDGLLRRAGIRDSMSLLWNANNVFGFERIQWASLARAARITTVSRYMKYRMQDHGVDALVVPNGLAADAYAPPDRPGVAELRRRFRDRTLLMKMARWDPDKRWLGAIDITAEAKRQGWRPLLIARGGAESHGSDVLRAAWAQGLRVVDRASTGTGVREMLEVLRDVDGVDVVNLRSHVDPDGRRMLFRGVDAVLANSSHEPFGLVGLETMAAGGIACTGCSGEDYAVAGQNALVLETGSPHEFLSMFRRLRSDPSAVQALRRAARSTARRYAWPEIVQQVFLPRLEHLQAVA